MKFEEALSKLKEGYCIRRTESWSRTYKKGKTEIKGTIKEVFGYIDRKGIFSEGGTFSMEDILAEDWIIKGKKIESLILEGE